MLKLEFWGHTKSGKSYVVFIKICILKWCCWLFRNIFQCVFQGTKLRGSLPMAVLCHWKIIEIPYLARKTWMDWWHRWAILGASLCKFSSCVGIGFKQQQQSGFLRLLWHCWEKAWDKAVQFRISSTKSGELSLVLGEFGHCSSTLQRTWPSSFPVATLCGAWAVWDSLSPAVLTLP